MQKTSHQRQHTPSPFYGRSTRSPQHMDAKEPLLRPRPRHFLPRSNYSTRSVWAAAPTCHSIYYVPRVWGTNQTKVDVRHYIHMDICYDSLLLIKI